MDGLAIPAWPCAVQDACPAIVLTSALDVPSLESCGGKNGMALSDPSAAVAPQPVVPQSSTVKRARQSRAGSKAVRRPAAAQGKKKAARRLKKPRLVDDEAEQDDDSDLDDTRSVDEESMGSLAEFVVDDETEIEREIRESRLKQKEAHPLDGIDPSNIVVGKRQRKKPERYIDPHYWQIMTQDMDEDEVRQFEQEMEHEDQQEAEQGAPVEEDDEYRAAEEEEEEEEDDESEETSEDDKTPPEEVIESDDE